jgi:uncharacterized protein (DUF2147 family)
MKNLLFTLLLIVCTTGLYAQADKILGTWYNEPKDAKIEVYKKGDKYYGKIVWLKNNKNDDGSSPRLDSKNEDTSKRGRTIVGSNIMIGLEWDADDNEWDDGEIYDPRSGSTYSLYAQLENDNKLFLKGYIGFSLIGRSTYWTRAN